MGPGTDRYKECSHLLPLFVSPPIPHSELGSGRLLLQFDTQIYPPHTSKPLPERMVAVSRALISIAGALSTCTGGPRGQKGQCDLSGVTLPLSPAQQTALGSPTTPLSAVGLGFGVQNYTCSSNNVFVCVPA